MAPAASTDTILDSLGVLDKALKAISAPMMNFTKVNPFSEQDNNKAYIIFAQCIHKQVKEIDDIVPVRV